MSPSHWIAHSASARQDTMIQPAEPLSRSIIQTAFTRLRQTIEAKDLSTEPLRSAALEALERAKEEIEHDPLCLWLSEQLERLQREEE
jgi:hypothetical protein